MVFGLEAGAAACGRQRRLQGQTPSPLQRVRAGFAHRVQPGRRPGQMAGL